MKRQWLRETRGSLLLAAYSSIIAVVERMADESGASPLDYTVQEELLDPSWVMERVESGDLTVKFSPRGGSEGVEEEAEIGGRRVTVRLDADPGLAGTPISRLYESAPVAVLRSDSAEIKALAHETTRSGVEYMVIYLGDGRAAFLEGEAYRVSLPFVEAAGCIHTHPEGSCGLSAKDVESGLDLLVEGGLFEAAATMTCAFAMYRVGFVVEDDYVAVKEALVRAGGGGRLEVKPRLDSIGFYAFSY